MAAVGRALSPDSLVPAGWKQCWVWLVSHALRFEVLSRGLPTDPVPESFEPERDADGRPVLDIVRYACGSVAQVGDRVRCPEQWGTGCEHDVIEIHGGEQYGDYLRVSDDSGLCPNVLASTVRLVSRGAEHQAMTDSSPRRPCCNEVGHDWNQATEICDHCGARLSVEVARGRAETPAPQPSLPSRYAAFRATVERVVAEEAPAARVVTDWSEKPWRGIEGGPRGFCELQCQDYRMTFSCGIATVDVEAWERDTSRQIAACRERLGDHAMGRKP